MRMERRCLFERLPFLRIRVEWMIDVEAHIGVNGDEREMR